MVDNDFKVLVKTKMKKLKKEQKMVEDGFAWLLPKIGSICCGFAYLELELNNAIGLLVDFDNPIVGVIISDKLNYSQSIDLFERLAQYRLKDDPPKELSPLVSNLQKAAKHRNDVVHSSWTYSFGENPALNQERVRRKHPPKTAKLQTITLEGLVDIDEFINSVFHELQDFETEYL